MKIDEIQKRIIPILIKHHILKAGIFGSVAKNRITEKSDIDILIQLGETIGLLQFIKIKQEIEDILGRNIDLVEYRAIKPRLKKRILSEEVRIHG